MTKSLQRTEKIRLKRFVEERFSFDELKALAFDLYLDWMLLPHETIAEFVRELIAYFERLNELSCLIEEIQKQRPDDFLNDLLKKLPLCHEEDQNNKFEEDQHNKIQTLLRKAQSALAAGFFDEAVDYLIRALEINPYDERIIQRLTEVRLSKRRDRSKRLVHEGHSALNVGDFVEAKRLAQEALDSDQDNEAAFDLLTNAHIQQEKSVHDTASFASLEQVQVKTGRVVGLPTPPHSFKALDLADQTAQSEEVSILINKAISALNVEMFTEATALLRQALSLDPENIQAKETLQRTERKYKASLLKRVEEHIETGRTVLTQERYQEATVQFEQAIKLSQEHPEIAQYAATQKVSDKLETSRRLLALRKSLEYASRLLRNGEYDAAHQELAAYDEEPKAEVFHQKIEEVKKNKMLGQQALDNGHFRDATQYLEAARLAAPRDREIQQLWQQGRVRDLLSQAQLERDQESYDQALLILMQARALDPGNVDLISGINETKNLKKKQEMAASLVNQGREALRKGKHTQAISLFKQAMSSGLEAIIKVVSPLLDEAQQAAQATQQQRIEQLLTQGDEALAQGQLAQAEAFFQKASNLGVVFPELEANLYQATDRVYQYRNALGWQRIAEEALATGDYDLALEYLERIRQAGIPSLAVNRQALQTQAQIQEKLAQAEVWLAGTDFAKAVESLAWILERAPQHNEAIAMHNRAQIELAMITVRAEIDKGQLDRAETILKKAQRHYSDPTHTLAMLQKEIRRVREQKQQARSVFTIAQSAKAAGNYEEAQTYLKEAFEKDPDDPRIQAALVDLAQRRSDKQAAMMKLLLDAARRALAEENFALAATHCQRAQEVIAGDAELIALQEEIDSARNKVAYRQQFIQAGKEAMEIKDYAAAVASLEQALQMDPDHTEAKTLLAQVRAAQEKQEQIQSSLQIGNEALSNESFGLALAESAAIISIDASLRAGRQLQQKALAGLRRQVEEFLAVKEFEKAKGVLTRPLQIIPHNPILQTLREEINIQQGKHDQLQSLRSKIPFALTATEKRRLLDEAILLAPNDSILMEQRQQLIREEQTNVMIAVLQGHAQTYIEYHNYDLAEEKYRQAFDLAPVERKQEIEIWLNQVERQRKERAAELIREGRHARHQGQYEEAADHYRKAQRLAVESSMVTKIVDLLDEVKTDRENQDIVVSLLRLARQTRAGIVYEESPLEVYDNIADNLAKALQIIPGNPEALMLDEANETDRADCRKGLKARRDGRSFLREGNYQQAVTTLQESIDLFNKLNLDRERIISGEYLQLAKKKLEASL